MFVHICIYLIFCFLFHFSEKENNIKAKGNQCMTACVQTRNEMNEGVKMILHSYAIK